MNSSRYTKTIKQLHLWMNIVLIQIPSEKTSPSTALVKLLKDTSLPSIIKDDLSCHQAKHFLQEKLQKSEAQINRVLIKQKECLIEFLNE